VERDRGPKGTTVGLVLCCLILGSSNAYALERSPSGRYQVEATQWTFDKFLTKWKSMYQNSVFVLSNLAGVPISQYKFKYLLPKEPIFVEGNDKVNEDALNDYAARLSAWYVIEKSSIDPKAPVSENKVLPDALKYNKENCEVLVKELQNERVLYFNENRGIERYGASSYTFREPIPTTTCLDNDSDGNRNRYLQLGAASKKWLSFEMSNFSFSRLIFLNLPPLNLVGKISTEEKFFDAIDTYTNSKQSLQLMNSDAALYDQFVASQPKIVDVSYSSQRKNPRPQMPQFDPKDPTGNFASVTVWGYLYQKWVSDELKTDDRLIFTKEFNPGQQKRQCESQGSANTNSFTLMRSAIQASSEAIQIQGANKDLNDKKLNASEISQSLENLRKALETYSEKLPVYLERNPSCVIYKVQISELEVLMASLKSAEVQLENLRNGDLKVATKYQENLFDRKLDQAIESTKKATLQRSLKGKSKVAMPLICAKDRNSIKLTHNGKRCPSGLIKINL
jgi:hypothetical protein